MDNASLLTCSGLQSAVSGGASRSAYPVRRHSHQTHTSRSEFIVLLSNRTLESSVTEDWQVLVFLIHSFPGTKKGEEISRDLKLRLERHREFGIPVPVNRQESVHRHHTAQQSTRLKLFNTEKLDGQDSRLRYADVRLVTSSLPIGYD